MVEPCLGQVVRPQWAPDWVMYFPVADSGIVRNGKAVMYSGNANGLLRYEICSGEDCTQSYPSAIPPSPDSGSSATPCQHPSVDTCVAARGRWAWTCTHPELRKCASP